MTKRSSPDGHSPQRPCGRKKETSRLEVDSSRLSYCLGGGGEPPKKSLNIVRMPRRLRFVVGRAGGASDWATVAGFAAAASFVADAGFGSATWPLKTQSGVTRASRIRVTNCGLGSTGGFGFAAEKASEGITILTGGSTSGAAGAAVAGRGGMGRASFAGFEPVGFVAVAGGSGTGAGAGSVDAGFEFFAGGFAFPDSTGGGGGAAASTVGITEVLMGRVVEIAGAGCC